jgi:Bacterial CdiA-CT RNAse A domain
MTRLSQFRIVVALALIGWVACQPSDSTNTARPVSREPSELQSTQAAPPRDLSQDEAAGGHVLRKHVGRSDDDLRERLEREPNISGAATYTDRPTAERVIGAALDQSKDRIQRWLNRSGGHPNLVLDHDSDQPIGRTMNRGERQSRPCAHALVVLKYDSPGRYHVLTSYPECR